MSALRFGDGLSEQHKRAVQAALVASLGAGTIKSYNGYLARFVKACEDMGLSSWRGASTDHILAFLCDLGKGLQRPSASLDSAIAALRIAFEGTTPSPLESPLIPRVKKGVVALFTSRPRKSTPPLPVEPIRDWICSLPTNAELSYEALRMKCAALAALVLIARPSDLTRIDSSRIIFEEDLSSMRIDLLAFKNDYHRDGAELRVEASSDSRVCFVKACKRLLELNKRKAPQVQQLFLDPLRRQPLSAQQVSAILKAACKAAGLDTSVFTARTFRPGGATRGIEGGLPLDLVMHIGRWRSADTVYGHYLRSQRSVNVSDVLLGVTGAGPALEDT